MIYEYPKLESPDQEVLDLIRGQRNKLRFLVNSSPLRWGGFLRRNTFARALQGSNSIEGFNANLAEAVAIIDEEKPETMEDETLKALIGYRTAMTYIMRVHDDPHLEVNAQFIRGLHYMMLNYDMTKLPGQWRPGPIRVVRDETNETVYEGPDANLVPGLMDELIEQVTSADAVESSTVLAAMAHLNLAMIHPFKDGNGRMARALQTLAIAQNGISSPVFCSIEEWLGRNTEAYYSILGETGQGHWNPKRSALPWVRFCLIAHYQQASTLLKRNDEIGRVWEKIERLRVEYDLPERAEIAMMDAAFGYKVRNQRYREEHDISDVVASRDLKKISDAGLIQPIGEKRGRYYIAAKPLLAIRDQVAEKSRVANPYDLIMGKAKADQLALSI